MLLDTTTTTTWFGCFAAAAAEITGEEIVTVVLLQSESLPIPSRFPRGAVFPANLSSLLSSPSAQTSCEALIEAATAQSVTADHPTVLLLLPLIRNYDKLIDRQCRRSMPSV
mmetsp:Transcript_19306/g.39647  ORF Transcript_19306/g.39647 Transcript_19306/m.39647 type:complete len:112 (-) Transcript_19306:122-457(-)